MKLNRFLGSLAFLVVSAASVTAFAQPPKGFAPTKTVTLVVPFTANSGSDIIARIVGPKLAARWGQAVIVDNKAGASGTLGANAVAKAAPDGHTLLVAVDSFTMAPAVLKSVPYDSASDFAPVAKLADASYAFAVHPGVPAKDMKQLVAWIKANPGKFTYNTPNSGGSGQAFVSTVLDKFVPPENRTKMETSYAKDLEKDWDQGFALLASLNPYVYQKGVYPNGNDQILALLSSGQISMAPVWSDQFITGQKTGQIPPTIQYTQISNPSLTGGAAYLGIPKTSPRQEGALKLANWVLSPEAQVLMVDTLAGYPAIDLAKLPPNVQDKFKDTGSNDLRLTYFAPMRQDLNNLWSQKVPGK